MKIVGSKMWIKRINILSLIVITTVMASLSSCLAFDADKEGIHKEHPACFYRKHGIGTYIFCGPHFRGMKCGPKKRKYNPSFDKAVSYSHGESKEMSDGKKYWCCTNETNRWEEGNDYTTGVEVSAPKQKANSDGTMSVCVTTTKHTVCGDFSSETCHNCPATTPFWRNGECTTFCGQTDYTMAFNGITSNECISCPTTGHQGIAEIDAYGCNWGAGQIWDQSSNKCKDRGESDTGPTSLLFNVCLKCNPATQFFDTKTKSCVLKSSREQKNKMELKQCWLALSSRVYECCLKHGSAQLDEYLKLPTEQQQDDTSTTPLECCVNGGSWNNNSCQLGE